jgi:hypothetical protein
MAVDVRLGPLVRWDPAQRSSAPLRHGARRTGCVVGLVVAVAVEMLTIDWSRPGEAFAQAHTLGLPTLVAGSLGGWIFGPVAWSARTDRAWLVPIVGLAFTAVVIGAFVVGLELALPAASQAVGPGEAVQVAVGLLLLTVLIGVPTLGLIMLPFTLAASACWALVMIVLRSRAARDR